MYVYFFFFFFQAEDGIRDPLVTGVQTCALPISRRVGDGRFRLRRRPSRRSEASAAERRLLPAELILAALLLGDALLPLFPFAVILDLVAGEKATQIVLESFLSILEILAQVLDSLSVEQGCRAVTRVETLVHFCGRDPGAVTLWSSGDHERIVDLRIVRGLLIVEGEQHPRGR